MHTKQRVLLCMQHPTGCSILMGRHSAMQHVARIHDSQME
jgi:hypothetical protein